MTLLCVSPRHTAPREPLAGLLLCQAHLDQLAGTLTEILELYATLPYEMAVLQSREPGGEKHTKAAHPPAPINLAAAALTDRRNGAVLEPGDIPDLFGVLTSWASNIADDRGLKGGLPREVSALLAFHHLHLAWTAAQPWVDEYDAEIRGVRRTLAVILGAVGPKPVGRCPTLDGDGAECGAPLWPHPDGLMAVHCTSGHSYDERLLRHLGGMLEAS